MLRSYAMMIKIIDQETTCPILKQRINPYYVRTMIVSPLQMKQNVSFRQFFLRLVRTIYATDFLMMHFRTDLQPTIMALRIISSFPRPPFLASLGIHILTSPEPGIKQICHFISDLLLQKTDIFDRIPHLIL